MSFCRFEFYSLLLLDVLNSWQIWIDVRIVHSNFNAVGTRRELWRFVSNLLRMKLIGKGMNKLNLVGLVTEGNYLWSVLVRLFLLCQV